MKVLLLLILGMFLATACGKSGKSDNAKRTAEISEEEIQAILNLQSMDCDSLDGKSCPEGMARLLIINKENNRESSLCSGFLVSEDTLITNQHCIRSQSACDNTYIAVYNGYSTVPTKCKSVVKILNDYSDPNDSRKRLDVAIVKLADKFYGKIFKIASSRPSIGENVTAWVIDHTGTDREVVNNFESRITQLDCVVSTNQVSASLWLDRCPTISGNSGSPLVNSNGEVVGVIWGGNRDNNNSLEDLTVRRSDENGATATEAVFFKDFLFSI